MTGRSATGQRGNRIMRDVLVRSERKHAHAEVILTGNGVEQLHITLATFQPSVLTFNLKM
jgi:hypothetical protein